MDQELRLRIVVLAPPADVDFGLQSGRGSDYETVQIQRSGKGDLTFECMVTVRDNRSDGLPNFLGPFAQGPATGRFIYVDIGEYAGQSGTSWARRMKIPLTGITWELIRKAASGTLETRVPGTGKDGGPTCATVRDVQWELLQLAMAGERL